MFKLSVVCSSGGSVGDYRIRIKVDPSIVSRRTLSVPTGISILYTGKREEEDYPVAQLSLATPTFMFHHSNLYFSENFSINRIKK